MALTEFQNLPSTKTPLNAENLNGNFDELNKKITSLKTSNVLENITIGPSAYRNDDVIHLTLSPGIWFLQGNFQAFTSNIRFDLRFNDIDENGFTSGYDTDGNVNCTISTITQIDKEKNISIRVDLLSKSSTTNLSRIEFKMWAKKLKDL